VSLSVGGAFTASVGAPRVAASEYPFGRPLGQPGDADGPRAVLRAALEVLERAREPGTVVDLPFRWPESPRVARTRPKVPPPIAQLLRRKPWLLLNLLRGEIPGARFGHRDEPPAEPAHRPHL
jgi:hypothetical protein